MRTFSAEYDDAVPPHAEMAVADDEEMDNLERWYAGFWQKKALMEEDRADTLARENVRLRGIAFLSSAVAMAWMVVLAVVLWSRA